jgi:hypothetical protein
MFFFNPAESLIRFPLPPITLEYCRRLFSNCPGGLGRCDSTYCAGPLFCAASCRLASIQFTPLERFAVFLAADV